MLDQMHMLGRLSDHAHGLVMTAMANINDLIAFPHETQHLAVHFAHQRAARIDDAHAEFVGFAHHLRRHAVRGEHDRYAGLRRRLGNLGKLVDEHGALLGEFVDDMPVVHDLPAHIHRGQIVFTRRGSVQNGLHGLYRAIDTRAEPARIRQNDSFRHACLSSHQS